MRQKMSSLSALAALATGSVLATPAMPQSAAEVLALIRATPGEILQTPEGHRFVIFSPLDLVWQLGETSTGILTDADTLNGADAMTDIVDTGWLMNADDNDTDARQDADSSAMTRPRRFEIRWSSGLVEEFGEDAGFALTSTGILHPLPAQYQAFLNTPLIEALGPLPAGAIFHPYWLVSFAGEKPKYENLRARTTEGDAAVAWHWRSLGEIILLIDPDGAQFRLAVADLVARTDPSAASGYTGKDR